MPFIRDNQQPTSTGRTGFVPDKKTIGGFLGNVASSSGQLVEDIGSAIFHPIDTVKGILNLGSSIVQLAIPGEQGNEDLARQVGEFYKDRYGGLDKAWNSFYSDPAGVALDAVTLLEGGGALLKGAGTATKATGLTKAGQTLSKAGRTIDPFRATGRAVKAGVKKLPSKSPRGFLKDASASLATKSLRPSPSQQSKFLDATGKSIGEFSRDLGLQGSGSSVLSKADSLNKSIRSRYNALTRSGRPIDPLDFIKQLKEDARLITQSDFSVEAQRVSDDIVKRAKLMEKKAKQYMRTNKTKTVPIDILTNTKSSAFSKVPAGTLADPTKIHGGKRVGARGVSALEDLAPGSRAIGKEQQAGILFQDIAKKQAGLGKGTQVINAFKPAGYGSIIGGVLGGGVPGALIGSGASILANSPKVLARGSKLLDKASRVRVPKISSKFSKASIPTINKVFNASKASRFLNPKNSQQKQPRQSRKVKPYKSSVSQPSNTFRNRAGFGKRVKLRAGSF